MTQTPPACPHCGQADKTYKVTLLYLEITTRLQQGQAADQPELDNLLKDLDAVDCDLDTQNKLLSRLVRSLEPPKGETHTTRRAHPDSMVIFFSLLALLFVFQIAITRSPQLPFIVILLVGSILAYLLARKTIIGRYDSAVRKEREENERVESAISRWMGLYLCSRDKGIFDPEQNQYAPLEQISELFYSPE